MTRILFPFILTLLWTLTHAETPVYILAENLEQVVTSSTLQWVSSIGLNDTMLENAVVAAYQIIDDQSNLQDSALSGKTEGKPVYVCRAKVNSIWVSGQLRPKKRACIVSMYKRINEFTKFEVLINIEGSARLSWVFRNKYILNPQGAVTSGEVTLRTFVARHEAKNHNKEGSLTHYVGKFNPSENLGVFYVVDQNNNELTFEEGQILVETEPISYELKGIKFDRIRSRSQKHRKVLGFAILKNTETGTQRVDSVISYNYTHSLEWGKGHGLLTGLNFTVHLSNGKNLLGNWALPKSEEVVDIKTIEKYLEEGTAVNVTLYGNYTEADVPYTATVYALYADNERKERVISDSKREHSITDVFPDFGPVYYIHNNSHVPTTTTTTTSTTTSATTSKATSTTNEVVPLEQPEVVLVGNSEKKPDEASAIKIQENSSMMSDASNAEAEIATTTKRDHKEPNSASRPLVDFVVLGVICVVVRRVT